MDGRIEEQESLNHGMKAKKSLLYQYALALVKLAETGDTHAAASELGTTRQTITRQIAELEKLLDLQLFERIGVRSKLSPDGQKWYLRAKKFCDLADTFLNWKSENKSWTGSSGAFYEMEVLPFRQLREEAESGSILQRAASAWQCSTKIVTCPAFERVRETWIVYRPRGTEWIAAEIGKKSAYAEHFGQGVVSSGHGS